MAFTKEEIEDLLFDAEQLHNSFKTQLKKDKNMDDGSLILYALKASKISKTLLSISIYLSEIAYSNSFSISID